MSSFYTNFFLRGKNLYLRRVDNGIRSNVKVPVHPKLFVGDKHGKSDGLHTDIFGNPLMQMDFETPSDARDFIKQYDDVEGFEVNGFNRFEYVAIDDIFPGELFIDPRLLNIGIIDIETKIGATFATPDNAHQEINAISIEINEGDIKSWSLYNIEPTRKGTFHRYCDDEKQLLKLFIMEWKAMELDVISGWNSSMFDMPYIMKRIEMVLGDDYAKDMSPWGLYEFYTEKTKFGADALKVRIFGIADLDLLALFRKFVLKKMESYSLDYISYDVLKANKTPYEGSLKDLYTNDPFKFVEYNQQDVRLVRGINNKKRLIELAVLIASIAKVNFEDAFSTSRPWDCIIGNYLRHQNIHVPCASGGSKSEKFEGAFVKDPIIGYHQWVVAFDLRSLYPSLMMQYNISPETLLSQRFPIRPDDIRLKTAAFTEALEYAKANNATLTANGTLYSRDKKGFIPFLVGEMFDRRKAAKDEQLEWQSLGEDAKKALENIIEHRA